jgi:hypothetical protein
LRASFGGDYSSGSSYISDADLFGGSDDSEDAHYLDCAPSPPRQYAMPPAPVALAPLYAQAKAEKKSRRKSSRKPTSRAKPMTPIIESPMTPE